MAELAKMFAINRTKVELKFLDELVEKIQYPYQSYQSGIEIAAAFPKTHQASSINRTKVELK